MMKKAWYKYLIIGSVVFLAIVAIIFVVDKKNKTRITNSDKNLQVSGDNIQKADSKAPVITLIGSPEITIEAGTDYEDSGCMAVDEADGDISEKVTKDKLVDSDVTGDVKIIYSVKNSAGIEVHTERVVHVVDTTAPDINLIDGTTYYIKNGTQYCEPGYEAEDSYDGNLTSKVKVSGNVDTQTDGKYTLTYEVEDAAGNKTSVERCVRVYSPMPDNTVNPGNKVVYLTFDDGPGKYTQRLLDVLDKYNVKATFFVTNGKPAYQNLIGKEAADGHTVAIHSASHEYSKIYQSLDAYFEDFDEMNDIIQQQTGEKTDLLRFPGGSSNTVSATYCYGIMSQLVCAVEAKGLRYCDWNVSSGDAGEVISSSQVVNNVINGIKANNVSVVLQHDTREFSVDAVEEIIQWGLSEGYTFLPITDTTPMSHHKVNN